MEVTDVKIREYEKGSMLGFVSIWLDGCMELKGFKLFKGKEGRKYDIGLPSEKDKAGKKDENGNDKYWPLVYIDLKKESGKLLMNSIKDSIIKKYEGSSHSDINTTNTQNNNTNNWPDEHDNIPF
jgi:DNA-binding cell septation regulator SpoVG